MCLGVRKLSWLAHARLSASVAVTMSLVLCAGAIAAPSRTRSRSAHPRRQQVWVLSPRQRRELAQHLKRDAVLSARVHKASRAASDLTSGTPFHRGDVFAVSSGGVQEYTPTGQLVQTIAGTAGARVLCFDPSGQHLILPGIGLFDSSGNLLASNWASVPVGVFGSGVDCVANGFGNVYADGPSSPITKYDLKGNALQTFTVVGGIQVAMDLAPDECTMYYSAWAAPLNFAGPFNVCTNTQESANSWQLRDDLRVLPNWQVLLLGDYSAGLYDTSSGQFIRGYGPPVAGVGGFRNLSLDPDGTSFWACCDVNYAIHPTQAFTDDVFRFDINSGHILAEWPLSGGAIAVYGPPLFGDANVQGAVDSKPAGTAEAFATRARFSGQMTRLHLYVDSSSTASKIVVGIYASRNGHPGTLEKQATISNVRAGSWNYVQVPVPAMPVTVGQRYWIAVLGPSGAGRIRFRDALSGPGSETSSQHNLTALPARWSTGTTWATGNLSANGS
jgi:hypothetical protein